MASALFGIATGALNAARTGLQTTSHNISNADTAGYARQGIVQTTNSPLFTGAGFTTTGTLCRPARWAARHRRSPAMI